MLDERSLFDDGFGVAGDRGREIVDALFLEFEGVTEVWWVVARRGDDVRDLLDPDPEDPDATLRVCRRIENGRVRIGDADPERDRLLSESEPPI